MAMADPHQILAPLIEPPLPAVPQTDGSTSLLVLIVAGLALCMLAGVVLGWLGHRTAPRWALHRIARMPDPVQAAHQLARLVDEQKMMPPPDWLQALERLRFGPPAAQAPALLAQLCVQAQSFERAR